MIDPFQSGQKEMEIVLVEMKGKGQIERNLKCFLSDPFQG